MHAVDYRDVPESGTRRLRLPCHQCGKSLEIARLKEHLRSEHQLDSTNVESAYLSAMMEVRRARRSRF